MLPRSWLSQRAGATCHKCWLIARQSEGMQAGRQGCKPIGQGEEKTAKPQAAKREQERSSSGCFNAASGGATQNALLQLQALSGVQSLNAACGSIPQNFWRIT